jgi:2-C-methyl-D-erythritol 4-phosphate cytidylyltransferase
MTGSDASFAAVLVAAGRGRRMGGPIPKAWLPLAGVPIALWSAQRLRRVPGHLETVLVVHPEDQDQFVAPLLSELQAAGVTRVVPGGETRQESVLSGARATRPDATLLLVHDAVRPCFPVEPVAEALRVAAVRGGAILALPARDTIKEVDAAGRILRTVPRETVWQAQTPQVFHRQRLLADLARALQTGFLGTDEASIVEHFGGDVMVVRGSSSNLKVTEPDDLALAGEILRREERPA